MSTGAEVPSPTPRSGAAERTERSGQRRSWRSRGSRPGAALLGAALLLAGCTSTEGGSAGTAPGGDETDSGEQSTEASADPALVSACTSFWGDPDYTDPLSRTVLDRAGTAPQAGPSDPFFYEMTGDDIDTDFESAPSGAQEAASSLSDWFRTQPERGADADLEAFAAAWEGVAGACAEVSVAASWTLAPGEAGTKPAALVCADVFDTPGTLTHFANANVLTSNMFKLVGLSPRAVPAERMDQVQATAELLAAEIAAVDDAAVGAALEQVRAPFQEALDGDPWSEGLQTPLTELGTACDAAGYSSPDLGEMDNSAVVGAHAARPGGTDHGGRS